MPSEKSTTETMREITEWTAQIERPTETLIVDQDGEIRKAICKKHGIEKKRVEGQFHPNMSPYKEYYVWECEKCEDERWKKYFENY